jgi:pyruvate/2-oxoglutarate dehydrogenase complex dihydrolipoamide dehydrogenase (E3) component
MRKTRYRDNSVKKATMGRRLRIQVEGMTCHNCEIQQVKTSVLPASAVPRAIVNRHTEGVFKIVADASTDQILGVHVVAENAGDVIYWP